MLARLARDLPTGDHLYEPKWDGFRALAVRDGDGAELWSRHGRPLGRYFPELVEGLLSLRERRFTLDGEIVLVGPSGFDFPALMARLHPTPSRVERLRRETPASLVAFDVIAAGVIDLVDEPFDRRRTRLEALLAQARPPILLTPITADPDTAAGWLDRFQGAGVDGVIAKRRDLRYQPGKRAMLKVKTERTAECIVAGFRWLTADRPLIGSLLLGLYDDAGELVHVGISSSLTRSHRERLIGELKPLRTTLSGHPWEHGFNLGRSPLGRLRGAAGRWTPEMEPDWLPLRPERVVEVAYDQVDLGRFRHPARFVRWRPDRDPPSCTFDQLEVARTPVEQLLHVA